MVAVMSKHPSLSGCETLGAGMLTVALPTRDSIVFYVYLQTLSLTYHVHLLYFSDVFVLDMILKVQEPSLK